MRHLFVFYNGVINNESTVIRMNVAESFLLKIKRKMPLEALLFVMQHLLLVSIILTAGIMTGTGGSFVSDISALLIILGVFILFFIPTAAVVQNILRSGKDGRRILCCIPLLIAGVYQTMIAVFGYTKVMVYESQPDSLFYTLLSPIQKAAEIAIYPTTDQIFYMGFPYNQLPQLLFYIVILPFSLFIYLLPSVDYDRGKITKEMKLAALLPVLCVVIPVIIHTVKLRMGLIDELMIRFFWLEIVSDIKKMGFFLLMPALSFLYIRHYKKTISSMEKF